MTAPIEITPQLRQAVLDSECERRGHVLNTKNALAWDDNNAQVIGPGEQVPHLLCDRCARTWLVLEESGTDYDDVVEKVSKRFKDPADLRTGRLPRRELPH